MSGEAVAGDGHGPGGTEMIPLTGLRLSAPVDAGDGSSTEARSSDALMRHTLEAGRVSTLTLDVKRRAGRRPDMSSFLKCDLGRRNLIRNKPGCLEFNVSLIGCYNSLFIAH